MSQDQLKAQANDSFSVKRYSEAIDLYSKAIAVDPTTETAGTCFANRAACCMETRQFEAALRDAEEAVKRRPNWFKAYWRKSAALTALRRFDDAVAALEQAVKIDPSNTDMQELLAGARELKLENDKKDAPPPPPPPPPPPLKDLTFHRAESGTRGSTRLIFHLSTPCARRKEDETRIDIQDRFPFSIEVEDNNVNGGEDDGVKFKASLKITGKCVPKRNKNIELVEFEGARAMLKNLDSEYPTADDDFDRDVKKEYSLPMVVRITSDDKGVFAATDFPTIVVDDGGMIFRRASWRVMQQVQ